MSYALIIAEVRQGVFEERNLDSIGLANFIGKDSRIIIPDGSYSLNEKHVNAVSKVKMEETVLQNPMNMVNIIGKAMESGGKPEIIIFTHSSSGVELASYAAGYFNLPIITDVSHYDKERGIFLKSYYADKIFGEFHRTDDRTLIVTVRTGSFKEQVSEKSIPSKVETIENITVNAGRNFIDYVEEASTGIDITKAEFLLSIGRGIGNKDEIAGYEELAGILKAVLACSRPVIDKLWLPKPRQVGTSGKTVKPKVYIAMGISGAFQHIAGMKDSDCIIAVNKDPQAPIFQYAHYGIIADANKFRNALKEAATK